MSTDEIWMEPEDELLYSAAKVIVESGSVSTGVLQRKMKIGYGRACRLMQSLNEMGIVGEHNSIMPRKVLVNDIKDLEKYFKTPL